MNFRKKSFSLKTIFQIAFITGGLLLGNEAMALDTQVHSKVEISQIQAKTQQLIQASHAKVIREARAAQIAYLQAMNAISHKKLKAAKTYLVTALTNLETVLAKNPKLSQALIASQLKIEDTNENEASIKATIRKAREALEQHQLQRARLLLLPLVSEIHMTSQYIPLNIYPGVIKKAKKLISSNKPKKAFKLLNDTLHTIVVKEEMVPITLLNAQSDIIQAKNEYLKDAKKNKTEIINLLKAAQKNLKVNKLLGYPGYALVEKELQKVTEQIEGGSVLETLFNKIENLAKNMDSKIEKVVN